MHEKQHKMNNVNKIETGVNWPTGAQILSEVTTKLQR